MSVFISFSWYFWKQWDIHTREEKTNGNKSQPIVVKYPCDLKSIFLFWMRFYYAHTINQNVRIKKTSRERERESDGKVASSATMDSICHWNAVTLVTTHQQSLHSIRSHNVDSSFVYRFICNNLPPPSILQFQLKSSAIVNLFCCKWNFKNSKKKMLRLYNRNRKRECNVSPKWFGLDRFQTDRINILCKTNSMKIQVQSICFSCRKATTKSLWNDINFVHHIRSSTFVTQNQVSHTSHTLSLSLFLSISS